MQNYVISLANAQQRRQHIQAEFGKHHIPFQFFDAVTPQNLVENMLRLMPNLRECNELTAGEKSCMMSHVVLWQKCVDEQLPYIAIFEDDVVLSNSAPYFLNETAWIEERFKLDGAWIIRLETFLERVCYVNDENLLPYHNRYFAQFQMSQMGTAGYILSYQAAQILLKQIKSLSIKRLDAIDNLLFGEFLSLSDLTMRFINPAICIQQYRLHESSELGSQLEQERAQITKKKKYTLWEKIKRLPEKPKRMRLNRERKVVPFE